MPGGGILHSFRLGNRGELLAQQFLSSLAFTTPVPRQEDIGFDFFCTLISRQDRFLNAGPFFTVQVKSAATPLRLADPHEIAWIMGLENPHLLCVVNRDSLSMDVYSTWNVMCGQLAAGMHPVTIRPGERAPNFPGVVHNADKSQEIYLGAPIVSMTSDDMFDEARVNQIATVISEWIALDRQNIVNRNAGMYWVVGPRAYETGTQLSTSGAFGVAFYWHPDNLDQSTRNLGRAASANALILRRFFEAERTKPPLAARDAALLELLKTHWDVLDDSVRHILRAQGINFDQGIADPSPPGGAETTGDS